MIREVCGFVPYEPCTLELLKVSKDKGILQFFKKRMETHIHNNNEREGN